MEQLVKPVTRPLTGEEYLESLRDGRRVLFQGEWVKDVTTHPAFRNAARSIARLYDALHVPETKGTLLTTDRLGILTHKFFAPPTHRTICSARGMPSPSGSG